MQEIRIFIAGLGHVGRAVLALLSEPTSPPVQVTGLADSSGSIVFRHALSPDKAISASYAKAKPWSFDIIEAKKAGLRLADLDLDDLFGYEQASFHKTAEEAITKACPAVLLELSSSDTNTGGAAVGHALAAFRSGADVVFASKGALAANWEAIMSAAKDAGRQVRYSATVGGGMPVIDAGRSFAKANPIHSIEAVLNGTSVYVLSLMETGMSLSDAIKLAQQVGMAETDPSADIDGLDAAAKLCILARSVMGCTLEVEKVKRESIRTVTDSRLTTAVSSGQRLRAVATLFYDSKGCIQAGVQLREVPLDSPLARTGSENAVIFHSRYSGTLSMIGKGAGPAETAPAVIRDIAVLAESWCQ